MPLDLTKRSEGLGLEPTRSTSFATLAEFRCGVTAIAAAPVANAGCDAVTRPRERCTDTS